MSICWGATDFGKGMFMKLAHSTAIYQRDKIWLGYDLANQTPYLDDMLRWSLDWLMKVSTTFGNHHFCFTHCLGKAHSSNNTLWVYVAESKNVVL
jgi:endoglucanase